MNSQKKNPSELLKTKAPSLAQKLPEPQIPGAWSLFYISLFPQPSSDIWPWPSSERKYWVRDTFKFNHPIFVGKMQEVEKSKNIAMGQKQKAHVLQ